MSDKFIQVVWMALSEFIRYDQEKLLTMKDPSGKTIRVKEEAVNHRVALYLEFLLRDQCRDFESEELNQVARKIRDREMAIDLEYDLGSTGIHVERKIIEGSEPNTVTEIRPDILIHGRVTPENNFAFIEIKKGYRNEGDKIKCKAAKNFPYSYKHALVIECIEKDLRRMRIVEFQLDGSEQIHRYQSIEPQLHPQLRQEFFN